MKILVTAGNTQVPIDKVRCITNVFTGRTGAAIAGHARERGHEVTLLTSHPEIVAGMVPSSPGLSVRAYRTVQGLEEQMHTALTRGGLEVLIHCAAVSDFLVDGVYAPAPTTRFDPVEGRWQDSSSSAPHLEARTADKIKSTETELWLRLVPTPKLIDAVRRDWDFQGILVKFKLEAGVGEDQLLEIAEQSRRQSAADLMVANTLEGVDSLAFLGPLAGRYERVDRAQLPRRLLDEVESLYRENRQ